MALGLEDYFCYVICGDYHVCEFTFTKHMMDNIVTTFYTEESKAAKVLWQRDPEARFLGYTVETKEDGSEHYQFYAARPGNFKVESKESDGDR